MIKNMTRKGLALGSAVALIVGGFVGALPAQAAPFVSLDATFGTKGPTQNGLLGQNFDLVMQTDTHGAAKLHISGVKLADIVVSIRTATGTVVRSSTSGFGSATVVDASTATVDAVTVVPGLTAGQLAQIRVSLNTANVKDTTTLTLTPFLDTVATDNKITANEVTGGPVSLTFHDPEEVTATTVLSPAVVGTKLKAAVTLDKGINGAAIQGGVNVFFGENGTTVAFGAVKAAGWDADAAAFLAESDDNAAANTVYTAQARVGGTTDDFNSGSAVVSSVAVGTATGITAPAITASSNALTTGAVKAGAGQVTLTSTVTAPTKAGQVVTFTITKSSLRATASVTAGGKTLASTGANSITVDVTTDADGEAALTLSYAGFVATAPADAVTVAASVLGASGFATVTGTNPTLTATAVVNAALVENSTIGANARRAIAKGGSASVTVDLVDQFGAAVTTERRFVYSIANASPNVEVAHPTSSVTTTGSSTITLTDSSTAASGTFDLVVKVQSKNTAGNWVDVTTPTNLSNVTVARFVMGGPAAATVTVTTASMTATTTPRKVLQTVDMVEHDGRKLAKAFPYAAVGTSNHVVTGVVRAANGAVVGGQAVTVAAAGIGFATGPDSSDVLRVGSITVFTAADGSYTAHGFSNKSGKVDFTVTAGAASTTTTAYYADAARTAGRTLTIDAPAAVAPGSTLTVKAMLVDKYGNPVDAANTSPTNDVVVSYNGPGLVVSTPSAFVDGAMQFGVLLGANDRGTATVTISVYAGTAKITTQKTITIGAVPAVAGQARGWTKFLDATNELKIYARDVVGAGKIQFMVNGKELAWIRAVDATDPKLNVASDGMVRSVFVRDMLQGRNVIEIYQGSVRLDRRIFTR